MQKERGLTAEGIEHVFVDIIDRVKALDPVNTRKWFDKLTLSHLNGGSLEILCPDQATVQYLHENCKATFTRAAQERTGYLVTVEFKADHQGKEHLASQESKKSLKLHPDYIFDNFIVGPSNRLAQASCVAVCHSPGTTYNPLFLYGNSGLGKTHLLHAVCSETKKRNHKAAIQLLSCEDFVNHFIRAIEKGDLAGFQNQFRTVDMLVIDDVQFLREREQSQEEFFHTFNAIYQNGKQIILSADSAPSDIPSLEERLISRFNWGLVARIDPPSYETRIAIVKRKAHLRGITISDQVSEYIAQKVQANIRELEGALTTIYAVSLTTNEEITLKSAREALEDQIMLGTRAISITDIIDVVTNHFNVRLSDLQSKRRSQSIALPRQICMYLARQLTRHSLEEIGGHLGGRDHTTVMHACSKIKDVEENDSHMKTLLEQFSKQITQMQYS
jgi:chromosomal replication initiator protein